MKTRDERAAEMRQAAISEAERGAAIDPELFAEPLRVFRAVTDTDAWLRFGVDAVYNFRSIAAAGGVEVES